MEETLRILVSIGFAMLLVLLRFDSDRFAIAEHLVVVPRLPRVVARRRIAWYLLALAIAVAILLVHPHPRAELGLTGGEAAPTILLGLLAAGIGILQAAAVGYLRYDRLSTSFGPGAGWTVANGVFTALVDEVAFRGAVLGFLLLTGVGPLVAILGETFLYALATRTTIVGMDRYLLVLALGIGLVGGLVTVATGGIGAAFIGHASTRLAVALFVGSGAAEAERDAPERPDAPRDVSGDPGEGLEPVRVGP